MVEDLRRKQAEDEKRRATEEAARKLQEAARAAAAEKRRADEANRIAEIEKGIADEKARQRANPQEAAAQKQDQTAKANEDTERQRREEAAEEARQRLAKLEEDRLRAKREQEQQEAARKFAEQQRELTCRKERATYGVMENDLSKLTSFAATSACDEVRAKANDRIAALNMQAQTCKSEGDILEVLKGVDPEKRDQVVQFEQQITCEKLRPTARQLLAKLDAEAKTQLVRNTQIALRQIGCFTGHDTGQLDNPTRNAIKRYRSTTDGDEANLAITPELLNEIKTREPNTCVAAIEPEPPPAHVKRYAPVREKAVGRQVRERPKAAVQARQHAGPAPASAPRAEAKPAQQRALGVGF